MLNKLMKKYALFMFLASFFIFENCYAQSVDPNYQGGWVNFGLGLGKGGSDMAGPAGELSVNYAPNPNRLWTVRSAGVLNMAGVFGDTICAIARLKNCISDDYVGDIGALYGVMRKDTDGYVSASAGLGLAFVENPGLKVDNVVIQNEHTSYTIGLPLEAQAFWTPFKHFGVGLIGFGDLNAKKSFGGALISLQVGSLK